MTDESTTPGSRAREMSLPFILLEIANIAGSLGGNLGWTGHERASGLIVIDGPISKQLVAAAIVGCTPSLIASYWFARSRRTSARALIITLSVALATALSLILRVSVRGMPTF